LYIPGLFIFRNTAPPAGLTNILQGTQVKLILYRYVTFLPIEHFSSISDRFIDIRSHPYFELSVRGVCAVFARYRLGCNDGLLWSL